MLRDQNRIELRTNIGTYQECELIHDDATTTAPNVLPGSLVELREGAFGYDQARAVPRNVDDFDIAVVIENALIGKGLNAKQYYDEHILCRRPMAGEMYLLRAVPGVYRSGQPVYAKSTSLGIYVSPEQEGKFIGWCSESYEIKESMVGLFDDSTRERNSTVNLNGAFVNLIRVRIGSGNRSVNRNQTIFTAVADGSDLASTTKITLTFNKVVDNLVASNITVTSVTGSASVTGVTEESDNVWKVSISPTTTGEITIGVTKTGITNATKSVNVWAPIQLTKPTGITCSTKTDTTATFVGIPEGTVQIKYAKASAGIDMLTGTTITPDNGSYSVAGLTANTQYLASFRLVGNGGRVSSSEWSDAISFTTLRSGISFTATANGSSSTSSTEIVVTLASEPENDLTIGDFSFNPADKMSGVSVTKASGTSYKISFVTQLAGDVTVVLKPNGYMSSSNSCTLYKYIPPEGYYGVCYPCTGGDTSAKPTGAEIKALESKTAIAAGTAKKDQSCTFALNEDEWVAAGGQGDFEDNGSGKAFIVTQNWGTVKQIMVSSIFNEIDSYEYFSVVIDGVTYSGYIAKEPNWYTSKTVVFEYVTER